jgi:uncharacterized protein involved in exopolysaccharide biosynthesis
MNKMELTLMWSMVLYLVIILVLAGGAYLLKKDDPNMLWWVAGGAALGAIISVVLALVWPWKEDDKKPKNPATPSGGNAYY